MSMVLALLATAAQSPTVVTLPPEDRWGLIVGLRRQLGGRFLIHGLADAEGDCRTAGVCATTRQLGEAAERAASVDGLLARSRVGDEAPIAIVSIRGMKGYASRRIRVLISVYQPDTNRWSDVVGLMDSVPGAAGSESSRRLIRWTPVANFASIRI